VNYEYGKCQCNFFYGGLYKICLVIQPFHLSLKWPRGLRRGAYIQGVVLITGIKIVMNFQEYQKIFSTYKFYLARKCSLQYVQFKTRP